jgi:glycine/D-amino acid oxidase-like deaminating enzyme
MKLSFWEQQQWFANIDYTIVGSGIVGLFCALNLRELHPKAKILVLERDSLPNGASTKNAGFACFGSISEILEDLKFHSEQEVIDLVANRWKGFQLLVKTLGHEALDMKNFGGYEVFLENQESFMESCLAKIPFINEIIRPIFKSDVFEKVIDRFDFNKTAQKLIFNPFESQIDTGSMMYHLLKKCHEQNILIVNGVGVEGYHENQNIVSVQANDFSFETKKLIYTTNGFASQLVNQEVKPARAQVLITEPIENLGIKGTFHLDKGYYYFRNIGNRILLGGGRNLDITGETTTRMETTDLIQNQLDYLLKNVILPQQEVQVAMRWSGIMGVGNSKTPIVKSISNHVYCGVRMGGMGVAIGSLVGKNLASIVE